jgi:hypothetical protein
MDITITTDENCENILIEGCATVEQAKEHAIAWCDENNCLMGEIKEKGHGVFTAPISSDDYL